jgi:hypothetical protein
MGDLLQFRKFGIMKSQEFFQIEIVQVVIQRYTFSSKLKCFGQKHFDHS